MEGDDTTSKADKMPDDHFITTSARCPANLLTTCNEFAANTTDEDVEEGEDEIHNLVAENSVSDTDEEEHKIKDIDSLVMEDSEAVEDVNEEEEIKDIDNLVVQNSLSDEDINDDKEIEDIDNLVVENSVSDEDINDDKAIEDIDSLVVENSVSDEDDGKDEEIKNIDNMVVENSVSDEDDGKDEETKNIDNMVVENSVSGSESDGIGYTPPPGYELCLQEPLLDIEVDDNTELWLMQLPSDQRLDDFEGQTASIDLDNEDGPIGSMRTKSGKVYSMVNFPAPVSDITVFIPGLSGTKVAGKISRHVNLVRFPEPDELISQGEEMANLESDSGETRSNSSSDRDCPSKNKKRRVVSQNLDG